MLQASYILHRRPYRETSLLLDVFTYEFGKISLIAKGAYSAKSARSAQLQVFQPLLLAWQGRSSLKTLTKADVPRPAFSMKGMRLYAGMYANELLYRLIPEGQPLFKLFESYIALLADLEDVDGNERLELMLRKFELVVLESLGILPDLGYDYRGSEIQAHQNYYLSGDGQFVAHSVEEHGNLSVLSGTALIQLDALLSNKHETDRFDSELYELKAMRGILMKLIDRALDGKVLESRELARQFSAHSKALQRK